MPLPFVQHSTLKSVVESIDTIFPDGESEADLIQGKISKIGNTNQNVAAIMQAVFNEDGDAGKERAAAMVLVYLLFETQVNLDEGVSDQPLQELLLKRSS